MSKFFWSKTAKVIILIFFLAYLVVRIQTRQHLNCGRFSSFPDENNFPICKKTQNYSPEKNIPVRISSKT